MPRKQMVIWTPEDKQKIVDRTVQLRLENIQCSLMVLVNEAMVAVLPKDRHRVIKQIKHCPDIVKAIETKIQEMVTAPEPEVPPFTIDQTKPDPVETVRCVDTKTLLMETMSRVFDILSNHNVLITPLAPGSTVQQAKGPSYSITSAPKFVKKPKTRITIVGLLADQEQAVKSKVLGHPKFGEIVALTFLNKDYRPQVPLSTDFGIVQKHTSHKWWDKFKSVMPAERVFFVDGGVTGVVEKVMEIGNR